MRLSSIKIDIKAHNADCIPFKVDLATYTLIVDKKVTERKETEKNKLCSAGHDIEPIGLGEVLIRS
jgi:hypothetical protein